MVVHRQFGVEVVAEDVLVRILEVRDRHQEVTVVVRDRDLRRVALALVPPRRDVLLVLRGLEGAVEGLDAVADQVLAGALDVHARELGDDRHRRMGGVEREDLRLGGADLLLVVDDDAGRRRDPDRHHAGLRAQHQRQLDLPGQHRPAQDDPVDEARALDRLARRASLEAVPEGDRPSLLLADRRVLGGELGRELRRRSGDHTPPPFGIDDRGLKGAADRDPVERQRALLDDPASRGERHLASLDAIERRPFRGRGGGP